VGSCVCRKITVIYSLGHGLCVPFFSDVNKDWTCKDKDKDMDQAYKDKD